MSEEKKLFLNLAGVVLIFGFIIWNAVNYESSSKVIQITKNVRLCKTVWGPLSKEEDDDESIYRNAGDQRHVLCGNFLAGDKGSVSFTKDNKPDCLIMFDDKEKGGCYKFNPTDMKIIDKD